MQFNLNSSQIEANHAKDQASALESKLSKDLEEANVKMEHLKQDHEIKITHLNDQLKQSDASFTSQNQELADRLQTAEARYDESKKSNLELQSRLAELMQNSGNNSAQLISLNEKLKEKEK